MRLCRERDLWRSSFFANSMLTTRPRVWQVGQPAMALLTNVRPAAKVDLRPTGIYRAAGAMFGVRAGSHRPAGRDPRTDRVFPHCGCRYETCHHPNADDLDGEPVAVIRRVGSARP